MNALRPLVALVLASAAAAAPPSADAVALTVARRGLPGQPAHVAMAPVPRAELEDWLGGRAGPGAVHVELEADPRGGLPELRVVDARGRVHTSLARPRDLTRARALLEAAMARPASGPVATEADLEGIEPLAPRLRMAARDP